MYRGNISWRGPSPCASAGESLRGREPSILPDGIAHPNPLRGGARQGDVADSAIIERIGVSLENLFDQQDLRYYSLSTVALSWNRIGKIRRICTDYWFS